MPRRTGPEAQRKARLQLISQWRVFLRRPDFRKDLQRVRRGAPASMEWGQETMTEAQVKEVTQAYRREEAARLREARSQRKKAVPPVETYESLLRKYRLNWLPGEFFQPGFHDLEPGTVDRYEKLMKEALKNNSDPDPQRRYYSRPAVLAEDPALTYYDTHETAHPFLRPGQVLHLSIDLAYPQDVLEEVIRGELAKARKRRNQRQNEGFLPKRQERYRLDKLDFQLKVFDLRESGKDFEQIARLLQHRTKTIKGRRNSIRSAYAAAACNIYRETVQPLDSTDETHNYDNCPTCRVAKTEEQFCRIGKQQLPRLLK